MKADRSFIRSIQGERQKEGRGREEAKYRQYRVRRWAIVFEGDGAAYPCTGGSEKLAFESVPIALERAREIGETPYPPRDYREKYPAALFFVRRGRGDRPRRVTRLHSYRCRKR